MSNHEMSSPENSDPEISKPGASKPEASNSDTSNSDTSNSALLNNASVPPAITREPLFGDAARKLLLQLLAYKVSYVLFAYVCAVAFPRSFNVSNYANNFHWPVGQIPGLAQHFMTWDGQFYVFLSSHGYVYGPGLATFAFYPLWPGVMWLFSKVFQDPLLSGLIAANVFSLFAWFFFHRLIKGMFGMQIANWALLFLIAYPGAVFFQFAYSESLFLFLAVLFFLGLREENPVMTISAGLLLPLTRVVGALLLIPAIVSQWRNRSKIWIFVPAISIGLGGLLYLICMRILAGDWLAGFTAQGIFVSHPNVLRIFDPLAVLAAFGFITGFHFHDPTGSFLDRLLFVALLVSLYPTYKLSKSFFLFSLLLGVLPAVTTLFMSYTRYSCVDFPIFLAFGALFAKPGRKYQGLVLVGAFMILQIVLLLNHINNGWSG